MAIKREKIKDGVFTPERITLETNDASDEAKSAIREMLHAASPAGRIQKIENYLKSLPADNPIVQMYAKKINTLLEEISSGLNRGLTESELNILDNASLLRKQLTIALEVMPEARLGVRCRRKFKKGGENYTELEEHERWREKQDELKKSGNNFSQLSKTKQAEIIKQELGLNQAVSWISKQLEPLSKSALARRERLLKNDFRN